MLNNFYEKENYFKEKLKIFTQVKENQKVILQNDNNLIIYDNDDDDDRDDCTNYLFILSFITKIIKKQKISNTDQLKHYIENLFSEYFKYIDEIIDHLNRRQVFKDKYLILLSRIDENISHLKKGILVLICTHNEECLNLFYKSILFVHFDFSKLF